MGHGLGKSESPHSNSQDDINEASHPIKHLAIRSSFEQISLFFPLKGEEILSLKERPDHNPTSNYILLAIIQRSKYKSSSSLIYA